MVVSMGIPGGRVAGIALARQFNQSSNPAMFKIKSIRLIGQGKPALIESLCGPIINFKVRAKSPSIRIACWPNSPVLL
jgi:hypothetical protein